MILFSYFFLLFMNSLKPQITERMITLPNTSISYQWEKLLGKTSQAEVYPAKFTKQKSPPLAIKVYKKSIEHMHHYQALKGKILQNVVHIYELGQSNPSYVLMELCQKTLRNVMANEKEYLSSQIITKYIKEIATGLASLKAQNFIHGDIKPENILLDQKNCVKIGDLDYILNEYQAENKRIIVGTLQYMDPEMLKNWKCSHQSDLWSLGIVLYEIYFGKIPFNFKVQQKSLQTQAFPLLYEQIKQELPSVRSQIKLERQKAKDQFSLVICDVLLGCLQLNPVYRFSVQSLNEFLLFDKFPRKLSLSTDSSSREYDQSIFSNTGLGLFLASFEKLNTILLSFPQQKNKFKGLFLTFTKITDGSEELDQALKKLQIDLESKCKKMERNFKRLSSKQGGIEYSEKQSLFNQLKEMLELLKQVQADNERNWVRNHKTRSSENM